MSLRSREKSIRRQQERQENIFSKQKAAAAIAKKYTADYLYAALFARRSNHQKNTDR